MLSQNKVMVPIDNEPVLAEATLVQIVLGNDEKFAGTNLVSVDSPEVLTIRLIVFRDEYRESFTKAPIKGIVHLLPELRRCNDAGCTCPAWHNGEGLALREPIPGLWRRQFVKYV